MVNYGNPIFEEFPTPPSHTQESVLLSCLLLNTILACARVLETHFDPLLQQLAYPLLQWLGDSDAGVSAYARGVIHSIATLCQYRYCNSALGVLASIIVLPYNFQKLHFCIFGRSVTVSC